MERKITGRKILVKKKMKLILKKLIVPVVWVLVAAGGVVLGMNWNNIFKGGSSDNDVQGIVEDDRSVDWDGKHSVYKGNNKTDNIQIPGFDAIWFKAGEKEQKVNFHNPKENNCYFKLSLYLPDGTKIWESELLAPGKAFYDITLDKPLEEREYEKSVLKYECFTYDDDKKTLNGADMKLTIKVVK